MSGSATSWPSGPGACGGTASAGASLGSDCGTSTAGRGDWPLACSGWRARRSVVAAVDPAVLAAVNAWAVERGHVVTTCAPRLGRRRPAATPIPDGRTGALARLADGRLTVGVWDPMGWLAVRSLVASHALPSEIRRWIGQQAAAGVCYLPGLGPRLRKWAAGASANLAETMNLFAGPPALDLDFARTTRPGSRLAGWAFNRQGPLIAVIAASDLPDPESGIRPCRPPPAGPLPSAPRRRRRWRGSPRRSQNPTAIIPARPGSGFHRRRRGRGGDRCWRSSTSGEKPAVPRRGAGAGSGSAASSLSPPGNRPAIPGGTVLRYRIGDTP